MWGSDVFPQMQKCLYNWKSLILCKLSLLWSQETARSLEGARVCPKTLVKKRGRNLSGVQLPGLSGMNCVFGEKDDKKMTWIIWRTSKHNFCECDPFTINSTTSIYSVTWTFQHHFHLRILHLLFSFPGTPFSQIQGWLLLIIPVSVQVMSCEGISLTTLSKRALSPPPSHSLSRYPISSLHFSFS